MQSQDKKHINVRRLVFLSLLASMAIVLSYFERFIPLPTTITGMKLGLANIITVVCIYKFSNREAFLVVLIRVLITSLLVGSVMSMFYSMAGGITSFIGMALVVRFLKKSVSPIGVSVVGAVLHILGQLVVLSIFTRRVTIAISYAPLLLVTSILTGIFVGVSSIYFMSHLNRVEKKIGIKYR